MPYSITTKDGITLQNIPDEIPSDSPMLRERVAKIRAEGMQETKTGTPWSSVAGQAVMNTPRSLFGIVKGVGEAVMHPLDTAKGVLDIAAGGLQNVLPESLVSAVNRIDPNAAAAEVARRKASAVGQFYQQRYGSEEGVKQAIAQDPASVLADAATLLTGGGAAAAKIPGLTKVGQAAVTAGKAIDPLSLMVRGAAKAAPSVGRGIATVIGGIGTHTGGESLKQAARAGMEGGEKAQEFAAHMRGNVPMESVLDDAKAALQNIREDRGAAYRQGMSGVTNDPTVLNFAPIDNALNKVVEVGSFKGKVINRSTAEVQQKISDIVAEWRNADPAQFHTVEGMDALKKAIGDIRDSTQFGTPSRVVADRVYNAVKNQITMQAPDYAKVMKDYESASGMVKEMERALSLGNKAAADTAMRKLQSLTRNNVSTNYGNRLQLAKELETAGAPNLLSNLSAQALSSWTPRGLGNLIAGGAAVGGAMTANPLSIPLIAAQSPRAMGELSFAAGRGAGLLSSSADKVNALARQLGISPEVAANYLYQAEQQNQRGLLGGQ